MNIQLNPKLMLLLAAMIACGQFTPLLLAQNTAPAPTNAAAPVQLSAEVWDVLRLAHANVGDATITSYIRNSGKTYSLGAQEILYLKEQGVSDAVLTAMLEHHSNAVPATQVAPQPGPVASPGYNSPPTAPPPPEAAPSYVQSAPVYAAPSAVYAYPPSYSYSYPYYPYYGSYWGYPAISFSFGWGGYYGGHYGYHGGGYHGGGYHGGGGSHGGGGHH